MGVSYTGKFQKLEGVKATKGIPPLWHTLPTLNFAENEAVDLNLVAQALDPEAGALTYTLIDGELPTGLTLTNAGRLFGTVSYEALSSYSFAVEVNDTKSTATRVFFATIGATNRGPVWSTAAGSLGEFDENTEITPITLVAADADGDTVTYSVTSGALPSGLSLSSDGVISGTMPNISGADVTSNFSVTAFDGNGGESTRAFSITNLLVNTAPVWTTAAGSLGSVSEGLEITPITLVATDAENDTLTFTVTAGALPTGLSLSTSGVISGIAPAVHSDTTSNFSITVSDGLEDVERAFSITVLFVNQVPTWTTAPGSLGSFNEEGPISNIALIATDADAGDSVTYAVTSGALPAGLTLSNTGVISGSLGSVSNNVTDTFTVTASDTHGGETPRSFSITTLQVNKAPVWTTAAGSLGTVNTGSAITPITLVATDPDGDTLTYSLANSTTLPTGLSLSTAGVISGTPTAAGTSNFDVQVSDGKGGTANRSFGITVNISSASYVGGSVSAAGGTISLPAGTQAGDMLIVHATYDGTVSGSVWSSGGTTVTETWTNYGYTNRLYWKVLTSADITTGSFSTSASSGGYLVSVYRNATTLTKKVEAENGTGGETTVTASGFTKAGNSKGVLTFVSDRTTPATATAPGNFTRRLGTSSTYFYSAMADQLTGYAGAAMTWTDMSAGYAQHMSVYELT